MEIEASLIEHFQIQMLIIIPHVFFSIVFMNPWLIVLAFWNLTDSGPLPEWLFFILLCCYAWLFSFLVDRVCKRFISKLKMFRVMACPVRMPRYLWIQLMVVITGIGLGYGIAYIFLEFC